ncbi:hypothetical protein QDS52_17690 [Acinetobacter baumannii]|uniref:hypothetical protein n=1 Tax=Acinetobacter baumannii TaxID=470 RepID=UPI00244D4297|nr:hypothetical protein [Acinetobacter baumannii]MDH2510827.1 hypothetical protein [Acinetobacter baumannii]
MLFTHKCSKSECYCSTKKIFSYQENKKKFEVKNPNSLNVCQYIIDGCVIPESSQLKCDCAYTIYDGPSINKIIFVELKGSDICHAAKQIINTYNSFKNEIRKINPAPQVEAFIIHSKSPAATQSDYLKFKKILHKEKISLHQVRLMHSYQL